MDKAMSLCTTPARTNGNAGKIMPKGFGALAAFEVDQAISLRTTPAHTVGSTQKTMPKRFGTLVAFDIDTARIFQIASSSASKHAAFDLF
jgi:hypothetical protein